MQTHGDYYRNYSKKYREKHPDYFREWRNRNPEYHNEWRANKEEFVMCDCGRHVNKIRMHLHLKTKLHAKGLTDCKERNESLETAQHNLDDNNDHM